MKLFTYKISSTFKRSLSLALVIAFISTLPTKALLDPDFYLEKSFLEIPTELEEKLNKKVDFNFSKVDLSEMLLLMSKVGDFNIVFPKELDREISIQIKQQSIRDTLEDLALLYDYEFEIKNNSVVFMNKNMDQHFQLIPLKYTSAALVLNILQEKDYNGVKLNKDPSLNNILAVGNIETIRSIEDFIKRIDIAPYQKIFLPEYVSYKAIQRFLKYNLNEKADVEINRIEQNYILLSGKENIVEYAYERLEEIDKPIPDQSFSIEAYYFDDEIKSQIKKLETDYKRKKLFRIDASEFNTTSTAPISAQSFQLSNDLNTTSFNLDFSFSKDILDLSTINLHLDDLETFFKQESDYAIYYLTKNELKKNYIMKKDLGISKNKEIILVIRALTKIDSKDSSQLEL